MKDLGKCEWATFDPNSRRRQRVANERDAHVPEVDAVRYNESFTAGASERIRPGTACREFSNLRADA
jgi:hypothetical protein